MHIQHLGFSCFKLTTKDATVLFDPYDKQVGLTPPRGAADIVVLTEKQNKAHSNFYSVSGEFFLAADPGEYDYKGVTLTGIPVKKDDSWQSVFLLESEDIKVLNLGHIRDWTVKSTEIEDLGDIDVLILPVGGGSVLDPSRAAKIVNEIDPKIVIPSYFKIPGSTVPLEDVSKFIKEMGGKAEEEEKIIIKKKDLSFEGLKVIVLKP